MEASSPLRIPTPAVTPYTRIHNDITDSCNLRCRFCFNTWPQGKPRAMSRATLERVLGLLPLSRNSTFGFLFSCLYEPSVHPDFAGMVAMLPPAFKHRVFMTTNLAAKWRDDAVTAVAEGGIGTLNLSLETFDAHFYADLCKGGRLETVLANIETIFRRCAETEDPPRFRFTTMILRDNMDELPLLAAEAYSRYGASGHEFRTPYLNRYLLEKPGWFKSQLLTEEELAKVEKTCAAASPVAAFSLSLSAEAFERYRKAARDEGPSSVIGNAFAAETAHEHGVLQIESSGRATIFGKNPETVDINDLASPYDFFLAKRGEQLLETRASAPEIVSRNRLEDRIYRKQAGGTALGVDAVTLENGLALHVRGWHALMGIAARCSFALVLSREDEARIFPAEATERKDIEERLGNAGNARLPTTIQGFSAWADIRALPEGVYECGLLAQPRPTLSKVFFTDLGMRLDLRRP